MNVLQHEQARLEADVLRDGEGLRDGEIVQDEELLYEEANGAMPRGYEDVYPQRSERLRRSELARRELVRVGDVMLGKYIVEKVPARSRGVVVLHAKHLELGHRVLIKFLAPESSTYPERVGRFLREARAAVRIQSEHVARVTDVGRLRSGAPYMVIEHPRGSDLAEVLRVRTALTVVEAVDYVIQACEAVSEAHTLGIIHGNLSLKNLVLCRRSDDSPLIKVLGFGGSQSAILDSLSEEGDVTEALPYVAPEQIRNATEADGRSDVWAFGAILHEFLTGSPVYGATTAPALLAQIAADPPMSVTEWRPDVPLELDAVIQHCLQKDPMARYPSVGELVHALAPFASSDSRTALERVTRISARGPRSIPPPLPSSIAPRTRPLPAPSPPPRRNSALVHVGSNAPPAPVVQQVAARSMLPIVFLALGLGGGVAFGAEFARSGRQTPSAAATVTTAAAPAATPTTPPAPVAAAPLALGAGPNPAALVGATPPAAAPMAVTAVPVAAPIAVPAPVLLQKPPAPAPVAQKPAAQKPAEPAKAKPKAKDEPEPKVAARGKDLFDDMN